MSDTRLIGLAFAVYLLAVAIIGLAGWLRTQDLGDYLLAGRRLGRWVTAISAGASDMSGWLLLGLPGYAYLAGYEAGWIAAGLALGTWLNWRFVARRLRIASAADSALTLPGYLDRRFHDEGHLLRRLSAIMILLFFLFYTSAGLVAAARLFESVFAFDYHHAVVLGTLAVLLYTAFGGFLAVAWTDLLQGLLIAAAMVAVALLAFGQGGGWAGLTSQLQATGPALIDPWTDRSGQALGFIGIVSLAGWGLGYFGQPHILVRFMAIRGESMIGAARKIAVTWSVVCLLAALVIGWTGVGLLQPPLTGADSEKVFIELVGILFHPLVAGICLAAILAAIMSTIDSQLLVASSALTQDLYRMLPRGRTVSEKRLLWIGRGSVLAIALLAMALALDPDSQVLDLVAYAWAGFGAAFGPVLLLALYWDDMTRNAAAAGIISGGLCVMAWSQLQGGWFEMYELVPAFLLALLAAVSTVWLGRWRQSRRGSQPG